MPSRPTVQFDVSEEDSADLDELAAEFKSRAAVARLLFLYGLNHSTAAFAEYAERLEGKRRKRRGVED